MARSKSRQSNSHNRYQRRSGKTRNYRSKKERSKLQGRIDITRKGFAFVDTEEGSFFIPASAVNDAFPGDLVQLKRVATRGKQAGQVHKSRSCEASSARPEARVVGVLERSCDSFIARVVERDPLCIAEIVDAHIDCDIVLLNAGEYALDEESLVRIRMRDFPTYYNAATADITEVLSGEYDGTHVIESFIKRAGLKTEFSPAALQEAAAAYLDVEKLKAQGYKDLTKRTVFTIDPQDAKDFDDALSLISHEDGSYTLGVHIADVAYFVRNNSSLDLEARSRASSVYMPHKLIPMLPEELSNNLCSLKPHELRSTITIDIRLSSAAEILDYKIYPSLICSDARMVYGDVQSFFDLLDSQEILPSKLRSAEEDETFKSCREKAGIPSYSIAKSLLAARNLTRKLFAHRRAKGALDFETSEVKFVLNDKNLPIDLEFRKKSEATQLVEEAMILANALVAHFLSTKNLPCIYRNHEEISFDNAERLFTTLSYFPCCAEVLGELSKNSRSLQNPFLLQDLLNTIKSLPDERIISNLVITSLKRALYSQDLKGHFGLALNTYAHFTSPIRRYPDLIVHRILHAYFLGQHISKSLDNQLAFIAEHSSSQEHKIQKLSYDVQDYFICLYMREFIGETFDVVIGAFNERGCFVFFENTAQTFVSYASLGLKFAQLDSSLCSVEGIDIASDKLKRYTIGEHIILRLDEVDIFAPRLICSRANS